MRHARGPEQHGGRRIDQGGHLRAASRRPRLIRSLLLVLLLAVPAFAEGLPPPRPQPQSQPQPQPPGEVCGDARLVGTEVAPIVGEGECGVAAPVLLSSAAGVALEPPATVGCATAAALAGWLDGVKPAFPAGLAAVTVVDAYSCRNRNRTRDGKLSEHALGNAIDIAAFRRGDRTAVTVLDGWRDPKRGILLRTLHRAACGTFGTVLGPEANALHADHLHLDVGRRRSGPYCE
jgi:hypothetical protein